jgi:hypothetical protein
MQSLRCRSLFESVFCWRNVKGWERVVVDLSKRCFCRRNVERMERDWRESLFELLIKTVPNVFWVVWRSLPYHSFRIVFSFCFTVCCWCQKIFFFFNFFSFLGFSKFSQNFNALSSTSKQEHRIFFVWGLVSQCQHWDWFAIIVVANLRWKSSIRI